MWSVDSEAASQEIVRSRDAATYPVRPVEHRPVGSEIGALPKGAPWACNLTTYLDSSRKGHGGAIASGSDCSRISGL